MTGFSFDRAAPLLMALIVGLAGCASNSTRAPVEDRSHGTRKPAATQTPAAEPEVQARPGYTIVKRGDTLIGISLEYGQDWRDIAAWNELDNPNLIKVGQELRVKPPEGAVASVKPAPVIDAKPLEPAKPIEIKPIKPETAPALADGVRREPKGGKVPYSDQALAAAKADEARPVAAKPEPAKVEPTKVEPAKLEPPKPVVAVEASKPVAEPRAGASDDDFDWTWPATGKPLSQFNESTNKGLDIGGQLGDPVFAAGAGKIVYVGSGLRGYGNLVIIKHNSVYLTAYAHNQKVLVKEGQPVKKGQEIAVLGDSDADRPKLHFEIRRQGKPVDPLKYLPKR